MILSLRVCSRFIALLKGYGIFNITYLNNLARELSMVGRAPEAVDAVRPPLRPQHWPDTPHLSKLHYPRSIITAPNSKERKFLFFRGP